MPILHENEHTYIYEAIINGKYKTTNSTYYKPGPVYIFDPTTQVYKYSKHYIQIKLTQRFLIPRL